MDYPFEMNEPDTLPPQSLTLRQFCRRAKDLLDIDTDDFVRFVLTGEDADGSRPFVDPILNRVARDDDLSMIRDYDSLLSFSSHVRINAALTVYPVPKNDDTLSHTIHIKHTFSSTQVGLSKICSVYH